MRRDFNEIRKQANTAILERYYFSKWQFCNCQQLKFPVLPSYRCIETSILGWCNSWSPVLHLSCYELLKNVTPPSSQVERSSTINSVSHSTESWVQPNIQISTARFLPQSPPWQHQNFFILCQTLSLLNSSLPLSFLLLCVK